jgi:hypothetical protein
MVTIRKHRSADGTYYEIDDVARYAQTLRERGIEPPIGRYRIFIPYRTIHQEIRQPAIDFESQVKIFFKLAPATEIECEVVDA